MGQSIDLAKDECVKVSEDYLSKLKIRKIGVVTPGSRLISVGIVCDNSDTNTDKQLPFHY